MVMPTDKGITNEGKTAIQLVERFTVQRPFYWYGAAGVDVVWEHLVWRPTWIDSGNTPIHGGIGCRDQKLSSEADGLSYDLRSCYRKSASLSHKLNLIQAIRPENPE